MRSRRLLFSSVCVFAVLVSVQLLAQSFAPAVPYGSGGNGPNAVAVADVNGDGIPDLVVANWCTDSTCVASSVGVLLGKGDGTFQPAVPYGSGGLYADSVAVADLRGTGKLDIVVGNCGFPKISTCDLASQGNIGVLLNNGDGTFPATATSYSLGPNIGAASVAIADLGNGTLDLIVAAGSATSSTVDVLVGNGDGTFKAAVPYDSGGFTALSVAVADVNGDNKPDVVVANWCTDNTCVASSVGVLLGNGDGTFQLPAKTFDSGGFLANSVAIGDVNADGKPDVGVGNGDNSLTDNLGNVAVLLGNGDGTFQMAVPYHRGGYGASSVALADMNGDGKLDLVVANCSTSIKSCSDADGNVVVLLGNGNGTFQTATAYGSGGTTPFGVAVGDVNGVGRPDIVAANCVGNQCGSGAGELGVLINTSVGSTATVLTSSPNPSSFGQAVTFTATVTSHFFKFQPTGTVTFLDGTTNIGKSPLNGSGVATLTTSALAVGTHNMT
ncbi:MAG: FG-GAP-like repeat-containing protein, partial [Terriglobales bacterium]